MAGSWQLRLADRYVRTFVKRSSWGDSFQLARRARRVFGSPRVWAEIKRVGLKVQRVDNSIVRGEWIVPRSASPGSILYIHGGGYVAGSTSTHRPMTSALARLTRRSVFGLDYRLAPEHRFPAAFDDTLDAYRWLLSHHDGDSSQIAIAGDSAGGGLTLAVLVAARDLGIPLPACAVVYSPWTDMEGLIEAPHPNAERCAMFVPRNIDDFSLAYLGDASRSDERASPFKSSMHGLPPILFQVGEPELLVDDSRRVHEKIRAAGGTSELEVWPHVFHGWHMLDGIVPEARQALDQSAAFIVRYLQLISRRDSNQKLHEEDR
jgi:acetyl esterase/lipase